MFTFIYIYNIYIYEIQRIYSDSSRLGYNRRFIDKARVSAKKGRAHEIIIRNGTAPPRPPRPGENTACLFPFIGDLEG